MIDRIKSARDIPRYRYDNQVIVYQVFQVRRKLLAIGEDEVVVKKTVFAMRVALRRIVANEREK